MREPARRCGPCVHSGDCRRAASVRLNVRRVYMVDDGTHRRTLHTEVASDRVLFSSSLHQGLLPMSVITRFAPSPTGFLHIGGARTALFNWLYAKRHGGQMLLRIEDTDRERSTEPAIKAILEGLRWLGIDWDGDVVYQFARAARHKEVAESLLASGRAYYCYASQEELEAMRAEARREG